MAYTQEDLDTVKAAILAIAAGERVVSVTIDGETVQYQQADLMKLMDVQNEIKGELQAGMTTQKIIYYTTTSKGL
jgi:hypothetical protein